MKKSGNKNILYAVSRTAAMNGMGEDATIQFVTTWWQKVLYTLDVVTAVFTVLCFVGIIWNNRRKE